MNPDINKEIKATVANDDNWQKYICLACGLIYDEKEGDPDSGIDPFTKFDDIPDDWVCPLCGVGKGDFELYVPRTVNIVAQPQTLAIDNHYGVVILGGGMAGWAVAEAVRSLDTSMPVLMISSCDANRYHKPELSIAISKGMTTEKIIKTTGGQAAAELNITLLAKAFALNIDSQAKEIHTTRGVFSYDKLVFATGASPFVPEVLPASYCWRINHLNGFSGLQQTLADKPQAVLIVGAGMIGTELAEDMARAGHQVTLVDKTAYPLQGILPPIAAKLVAQCLAEQGIRYLAEHSVTGLSKIDNGYTLSSRDSQGLEYQTATDQVIVSAGLTVDSRLPQRAGLDFSPRTGIKVNSTNLQTSNEHIYALGDCVDIDGSPCRFIAPIHAQARTIAAQVTGQAYEPYQHTNPVIRLKTKGISVMISGSPNREQDWSIADQDDSQLVMQQVHNGDTQAEIVIKYAKSA